LNLVSDVSPVNREIRKDNRAVHLYGAVVWVKDSLRVHFSHNNGKVVCLARSVVADWSESYCLGVIRVDQKGRITSFLKLHLSDEHVSGIVVLRILYLWQLIGNNVSDIHNPGSLHFGDEIGVRVF
jgi:hypothetical protein